MVGIKNLGYNNIELEKPLFTIELSVLLQSIINGDTFELIDGETNIEQHFIHSNYKVEDLVKFLVNGSFDSFGVKYILTEGDLEPTLMAYNLPLGRKSIENQSVFYSLCSLTNGMVMQFTLNAYINEANPNPYSIVVYGETVTQQS